MERNMQADQPHLQPMAIGDILDAMFRVYRNNFLTFIGIAALAQLPIMLVQIVLQISLGRTFLSELTRITELLTRPRPSFGDLALNSIAGYLLLLIVLGIVQAVVVQPLMNGALTNAAAKNYLAESTTIFNAYQLGSSRITALIVAGLLVGLIAAAIVVVFMAIYIAIVLALVASADRGNGSGLAAFGTLFCVLGLIVLAIGAGLYVGIRLLFVTQAIVIEEQSATGALGRSWELVRGSFWRTLGLCILFSLLIQIIAFIPVSLLSSAITLAVGDPANPLENFALVQVLNSVVSYGAQILILPLQMIAFTLMYYDLRVRKEGYDLELRARAASPEGLGF
jgi:hypothetical protein